MTIWGERMDATISASDFKARCLDLFDQLAARKLDSVTVTKRGRPVAVIRPPAEAEPLVAVHGFLRGSVTIPPGVDVTEPAFEGEIHAGRGRFHE